jgi:hypothetical protein
MDAATPSQQERTEVELVLQSGVFDKAPRLAKFLRYICEKHFDGHADQIKEYSIAIEALGRGSDFDPKKDSIVRVEAHRLRKRLEEYYLGAGASRPIQIAIPNGQYRPHFVFRERVPESNGSLKPRPLQISGLAVVDLPSLDRPSLNRVYAPPAAKPAHSPLLWSILVSVALLIVAAAILLLRPYAQPRQAKTPTTADPALADTWNPAVVRPAGAELRILAGYHGPPYIDRQGHTWNADSYFRGGSAKPIPLDHFIEAQPDPRLLKSVRTGQFRYDIPLTQGAYELHLYFAETEYGRGNPLGGGEGTRTFGISLNGERRFAVFDPLAQAGAPNRLDELVLKDVTPAKDDKLHLSFDPWGSAQAMLNALEILPSQPGRIHPVRMVMQSNPVTDSDGRLWAADEYFLGGTQVLRDNVLLNPKERALYQGERYGNFSYRIPLAPGKYRLTLHFAEQWFGVTPTAETNSLDYRAFDVFANRVALLKGFRIGREAHGANRSLEKSFDNLQPNAQGILLLEFVPVRNYAEVNAIEVVTMP